MVAWPQNLTPFNLLAGMIYILSHKKQFNNALEFVTIDDHFNLVSFQSGS